MVFDTDCVLFLPLIANMLFVSINYSPEKVFVRFPAFLNLSCCVIFELNKSGIRELKCDTRGFMW